MIGRAEAIHGFLRLMARIDYHRSLDLRGVSDFGVIVASVHLRATERSIALRCETSSAHMHRLHGWSGLACLSVRSIAAPYGLLVAMSVDTKHQPSNGRNEKGTIRHRDDGDDEQEPRYEKHSTCRRSDVGTICRCLCGRSQHATDPSTGYGQAPAATYGTGGYVFPDEGSPSGELGNLVTQPQPQPPQTGPFSHVYLFPPAA